MNPELPETKSVDEKYPLFGEYALQTYRVADFGLQSRHHILHKATEIGHLTLKYSPQQETVHIGLVNLFAPINRRLGIGSAVYHTIPRLPIPEMSFYDQSRADFIASANLNDGSRGVWEKLVAEGFAQITDEGFTYIAQQAAQEYH
jgi:hypothetical protein